MSESFVGILNIVVANSGMASHPIVPHTDGTIVPLDTDLQVCRNGDVLTRFSSVFAILSQPTRAYLEQELEKRIGLSILQAYDARGEACVDV
jgi:hypothetical protein